MRSETLGNVASCFACFKKQGHLWVLATLFRPLLSTMGRLTWFCWSSNVVRFVPKRDLFCPDAWAVLSINMVRFVLRRGPFCPEMWFVLCWNAVRFVWSVLSMVRFVRVPSLPELDLHTRYMGLNAEDTQDDFSVVRRTHNSGKRSQLVSGATTNKLLRKRNYILTLTL